MRSKKFINEPESLHFRQFSSGAGSEATAVTSAPYAKFTLREHGFLTVSITDTKLLAQFISYKGDILYTTAITK